MTTVFVDGIQYVPIGTTQPPVEPPVIPPVEPPVEPPVTPPGTSTPPAGWSVIQNPLTSAQVSSSAPAGVPLDVNQGRTYIFDCPANCIHSFAVTFNGFAFPGGGASVNTNQVVVNTNKRNTWFSDTPGGLPPVDAANYGNKDSPAKGSSEDQNMYVVFNSPVAGCVFLQKGVQYWLNVKPTNTGEPIRYLVQVFPQA